ncbi:MAG: NUDIX domain-containing protein [Bradymonadales bacterium]|nr:NUDIX domain-containing protein [Bradymonadales bacterium]
MPMTPRFCSQCGGEVEKRPVDDRARHVCTRCGTVFYRNPLPVASTVVLNEQREVLLVKRKNDPYQGMWCLPIGFAELKETIAQAALRELREETGISGRILRLLDSSSTISELYGDILVVTFEAIKTEGQEQSGDDAEAVAYFGLDQLPPLAFAPNLAAIQACAEGHREEWAIQDSFKHLQWDKGQAMLSDALVLLVKEHAREIAERWLGEVRSNPTTTSYRTIDADHLRERAATALSQFTRWLVGTEASGEVRQFYRTLGMERRGQGFQVHEVLSSLTLLRKNIWMFAREQGVWERPIDVYRVLELDRRIVAFFDRAMYHTAGGFAEGS